MRRHYAEFFSPGTFFCETSILPIEKWDTSLAVELAKTVTERYNSKPYGFRFLTKLEAAPVPDGEGGELKVQGKEVDSSGMYFLGGTLRNIDEVKAANNPKEQILLSNMRGNDYPIIIENCNSWKFTGPFSEQDAIVDANGKIIKRGNDPELVAYRQEKLLQKNLEEKDQ